MDKKKPKELTIKQKKFAHEYFDGKSGADAVRNAGYNTTTDGSTYVQATRLVQNESVQNYLKALLLERFPNSPTSWLSRMNNIIETGTNREATEAFKALVTLTQLGPQPEVKKSVTVKGKLSDFQLPKE